MAFDIDAMKKKVMEVVEPVCKATCPVVNQITEKSCDLWNKGKFQTEILKLQYQITQDEKALKLLYAEAGKVAYQNHVEGNASEALEQQFLLIQEAEEKITAAKDQIIDYRAKMEEIDEAAATRAAERATCQEETCCCEACAEDEVKEETVVVEAEVVVPAEEAAAPVEEAAAPAEEAAAPAEEAAAPVEEAAAPVEEAAAPVEEAAAPVEEVAAPAEEKSSKRRNNRKH